MYTVDNAVIMAAGAASRFAPLSYERPKALIEVKGEEKDDAENADNGNVTDAVNAETSSNDGEVTETAAEVTDNTEA